MSDDDYYYVVWATDSKGYTSAFTHVGFVEGGLLEAKLRCIGLRDLRPKENTGRTWDLGNGLSLHMDRIKP